MWKYVINMPYSSLLWTCPWPIFLYTIALNIFCCCLLQNLFKWNGSNWQPVFPISNTPTWDLSQHPTQLHSHLQPHTGWLPAAQAALPLTPDRESGGIPGQTAYIWNLVPPLKECALTNYWISSYFSFITFKVEIITLPILSFVVKVK